MKIISKIKLLLAFVASATILMSTSSYADGHGGGMNVPKIGSMVIMSGLENPWDIAFTNDGKNMFYTEKTKGLSVKTPKGVNALLGMKGTSGYADTAEDLFSWGAQEGMLGVALDPNFKKNRTLYLYSTSNKYHGDGCKSNFERCDGNIVMKFTVSKDFKSLSNRTDIVKDIQFKPFKSDQPFGGPGAHNGGRIRVGPDGYLWVGTGDRHRGICPQDNSLICGVVLRIDGDGNGHPKNKIKDDKRI
jgi:glucose/arabinose dehydrogenase